MEKGYPTAIGLTPSHGWMAIYEGNDYRGTKFEKVFWMKEPSKDLTSTIIEVDTGLQGGPNMLVPQIFREISAMEVSFSVNSVISFIQ